MINEQSAETLKQIALDLVAADRVRVADSDTEGAVVVQMSDELATRWALMLLNIIWFETIGAPDDILTQLLKALKTHAPAYSTGKRTV